MARAGEMINPARRLGTLREAGPGIFHTLSCRHCGHIGALPIELLVQRFGVADRVQRRLVCFGDLADHWAQSLRPSSLPPVAA